MDDRILPGARAVGRYRVATAAGDRVARGPVASGARVLVTGGAAFIGSHLAEHFIAARHRVTVVDNLVSGKRQQVRAAAACHELDIWSPEAAVLVRSGGFDVVAHLAGRWTCA